MLTSWTDVISVPLAVLSSAERLPAAAPVINSNCLCFSSSCCTAVSAERSFLLSLLSSACFSFHFSLPQNLLFFLIANDSHCEPSLVNEPTMILPGLFFFNFLRVRAELPLHTHL